MLCQLLDSLLGPVCGRLLGYRSVISLFALNKDGVFLIRDLYCNIIDYLFYLNVIQTTIAKYFISQ